MYGREELDVNKLVYATDIDTMLVDCEGTEVWPQDGDGNEYYFKTQADNVMDAMEARIKELEKMLEDVQNTMATENVDLGMENHKLKERIEELEAVISKMETTTPKWVSVKDRLPKGNPIIPALDEDNQVVWWGNWHDDNLNIYGITHWSDKALPPPPTTKENK